MVYQHALKIMPRIDEMDFNSTTASKFVPLLLSLFLDFCAFLLLYVLPWDVCQ